MSLGLAYDPRLVPRTGVREKQQLSKPPAPSTRAFCRTINSARPLAGSLVGLNLGEELQHPLPRIVGTLAVCVRQPARGLEVLGDWMEDEG
jgi:hypothetical protein